MVEGRDGLVASTDLKVQLHASHGAESTLQLENEGPANTPTTMSRMRCHVVHPTANAIVPANETPDDCVAINGQEEPSSSGDLHGWAR
jgi:hypothetical protein